jgi:FkbM family methyltransferase
MPIANAVKTLLNRRAFSPIVVSLANGLARLHGRKVQCIFVDDGIWMHQTSRGYFAYHQPYLRLDLARFEEFTRRYFFWGYQPKAGDVVMEVGAGVGEETLTFSQAVGGHGKVISIEAHPRTYRCLEKMVAYNRLQNVIPVHMAVTEPGCAVVNIGNEDKYLANRLSTTGVSVSASTIDRIYRQLGLGRIHFLKMNIEGAERLAIRGMAATLAETEVVCVSCHDFLAKAGPDDGLRTKSLVREFLEQNGLQIVERTEPGLPPFIRDQVWAYNRQLIAGAAHSSR